MIRYASIKDKLEIDSLLSYFNNTSSFDNEYKKYLVYSTNKIVSVLSYTILYDAIEIEYIYTKDEYKNMGYASKLMEYLIHNNKGADITLEVNVNNSSAIKFYEKMGFKTISIRKRYYNNEDAYLMHRKA